MTGRAEQNVLRTLNKLAAAGIMRLDRGEGRARRPGLPPARFISRSI